jgi:tetratricopeptide (TPR) repeat protein
MPSVNAGTFGQIEKLLGKRDFKRALKEARVAYRQSASAVSRSLLQRCTFARADELLHYGLAAEAQHVLDELSSLQPLPAEICNSLPELLVRMGLFEQYAPKFGIAQESMNGSQLEVLADSAVLSGKCGMAELSVGASAVRDSLQSFERGELDVALHAVDAIPRSSPFADWKLFLRGLAAYYRGEDSVAIANWERLDKTRKAHRIASCLQPLLGAAAGARSAHTDRAIAIVERAVGGESLSHLENMRVALNDGDPRRASEVMKICLATLLQRDSRLRDRVVELATQRAIKTSSADLLEQLIRVTTGPAFDPHWNRAWALLYENDYDSDGRLIEEHWKKYAAEIAQITIWSDAERRLAEACVWNHLGDFYVSQSAGPAPFLDRNLSVDAVDPEVEADRRCARECFSKAQELAPEVREFWASTIEAAEAWGKDDETIAALAKLIEHFPEDLDSLMSIGKELLLDQRPEEAMPYLERALRLKPLDDELRDAVYWSHVGIARSLALKKQFVAARQEIEIAEKFGPKEEYRVDHLINRSLIELKEGNFEQAEELELQARQLKSDLAYVLLRFLIEAHRFKLPSQVGRSYEQQLRTELRKKCSSSTSGQLAKLLTPFVLSKRPYTQLKSHCEIVFDYVKRASRVKFEREDLRSICKFFIAVLAASASVKSKKLSDEILVSELEKAAKRGEKQFSDDPCFPFYRFQCEFSRGPGRARPYPMKNCLDRALALAIKYPDLAPPGHIDAIRSYQDALEIIFTSSPFGGGLDFHGAKGRQGNGGAPIFDMIRGLFGKLELSENDMDEFWDDAEEET